MDPPRSNTRWIIWDGICTTAMNAFFAGPFLAAFALALGASHWEIGLISAIAFLSMPMQIVGLYAVDRWKRRRALIVLCALIARLLWIIIVCLPFFPEKASVRFLLTVLLCIGFIAAIPGPAWHSLVRSLVPVDTLGKVFSKRRALGTIVGLSLTLGGGFVVDAWPNSSEMPPIEAYSVLFSTGILFGLISVLVIMRLPEPQMEGGHSESFRSLVRIPLRDAGFRSLLGFIAVWNFSINLATPFFVVFMLERLKMPMRAVTVLIVLQQLVYVFSVRIWGTLSDRFSNKSGAVDKCSPGACGCRGLELYNASREICAHHPAFDCDPDRNWIFVVSHSAVHYEPGVKAIASRSDARLHDDGGFSRGS